MMTLNTLKKRLFFTLFIAVFSFGFASSEKETEGDKEFNPKEMILHHVKDAYGMH
ncbi:MAG: F0F1 ATP synthase subunit A, partial [Winogradskyella sp.]|nr:F0F1 ATP synthase subunit A [Winogradskyella sp.]